MRQNRRRYLWRVLSLLCAGLACLPAAAFAQAAPTTLVERTPRYTVVLAIGPAEQIVSPMDAMHGQAGEVAVTGGGMEMMAQHMDQGLPANHSVNVHIALADAMTVVMDVTPTIRITDKTTGVARDLPAVMGMYGSSMGPTDFHYGQNVFLPDGTYVVTVMVGASDAAQFREVAVMASPMMADHAMTNDMNASHDMGMSHEMSLPEGTAKDGRMFSQESAVTQALFRLVWGDHAAQEWVNQHNAALPR
jgi:hypothetical protein